MKAVGYFREPARDRSSLAEQHKAFLDFCARENLNVDGTFADENGDHSHAPGFRQLLTFLRDNDQSDSTSVVVTDVHALGHDLRDAAVRMFEIASLGAHITPLSGDPDIEAALMAAWTSDGDNDRLSDRVRTAMRKQAVNGAVLGRPPYGYKVGARRRLELVPEEKVVVQYIFRLYLKDNMGIRLIARRLNEEAIKTRRGGSWSMVSVRDVLRNRSYLGTYSRFNVRVSGTHPALVTVEEYHAVQERLDARRTSHAPRVASQFLLSGIAHCGYCANKLIGVSRKQSWKRQSGENVSNAYRYYQCESRTNLSICDYHTRRADELETLVRDELTQLFEHGGSFPAAGDVSVRSADQRAERDRLRARLRAIDRRVESYIDAAARGRATMDKMRTLSMTAATERILVEDALEDIEHRMSERISVSERKRQREQRVHTLLETWDTAPFEERQSSLRDALQRIEVLDDAVTLTLRP